MPGMLVTQPVGHFPELGALLLSGLEGDAHRGGMESSPWMSPGELGMALCGLSHW